MPTIVKTLIGHVTGLWGTATIKRADGQIHPLSLGDVVHQGDVILTSQNGLVQLTDDQGTVTQASEQPVKPATPPSDDIERVITGLESNDADAATAAGLTGGDGAGDLGPGLRVDRVSEATTTAGLVTSGDTNTTVQPFGGETAPENQLAASLLVASSSNIAAAEDGAGVNLGLTPPSGSVGPVNIVVSQVPTIGQILKSDGTPVTPGAVLTPSDIPGLVYVPPTDYNGTTPVGPFNYQVTDGTGKTSTGGTAITLTPVNDPPLAVGDTTTTVAGTPVTVNVLANDSDRDGDPLVVRSVTVDPSVGRAVANADGTISFTPAAGVTGTVTLNYTIADPSGATSTSTVTVDVHPLPPNVAPIASSSTITSIEGGVPVSLGLTPPSDANGDPITTTVTSVPTIGQIQLSDNTPVTPGQVLTPSQLTGLHYVPPADYVPGQPIGPFTYTVSDERTQVTGQTTIVVTPVDDLPSISTAKGAITENQPPIGGTLTATDADNPTLAFVPVTRDGAYGSLKLDNAGHWTYTLSPAAQALAGGQVVNEHFTVTLNDGSTTTVTITVTGTDNSPLVSSAVRAITEDQPPINGTLTATDPDNPSLTFVPALSHSTYGTLTLDSAGHWSYALTPAAQALAGGEKVQEIFPVTLSDGTHTSITINVTGTDDAPVISTGIAAITEGQPPVAGRLTATDADNPTLRFVEGPHAGTFGDLVMKADGTWTYTLGTASAALAAGQVVHDKFDILLNDGSKTTVDITVTGTDTSPVVSAGEGSLTEDEPPIRGTLTAHDPDNLSLAFVPAEPVGAYGSLSLKADGNWTYTLGASAQALKAGQVVTEVFTVTLTDKTHTTVTIKITGTDDLPEIDTGKGDITEGQPPITGTLHATDVDNPGLSFDAKSYDGAYGGLKVAPDGTWTYTLSPKSAELALNQKVDEHFTVTLSDNSTTTVTVTITGTDNLPVISTANRDTVEDSLPIDGQLTAVDIDNPSLSFDTTALHGTYGDLDVTDKGAWTYTLNAKSQELDQGQIVVEQFTVKLSDGSTTTVAISVTGTNDVPVAFPVGITATEDGPLIDSTVAGQSAHGTDIDAHAVLTYALVDTAPAGLVFDSNGHYTFVASDPVYQSMSAGETKTLTVQYSVTDEHGKSSTSSLTITVIGANDAPSAIPHSASTPEDHPIAFEPTTLLDGATDPDGDPLNLISVQNATNGHVAIVDNKVVFTPNAGYNGPATFTYTIDDGHGGQDTKTVDITVYAINHAPAGTDATLDVVEDTPRTLLAQDFGFSDIDSNKFASVTVLPPSAGSLMLNGVLITGPQTILVSQLTDDIHGLQFTPALNANGAGYANLSFIVQDDGGIANNGIDTDPSANTLTFNVVPENDLPIAVADHNSLAAGEATVSGNVTPPGNALQDRDVDGTFTVTGVSAGTPASAAGQVDSSVSGTYGSVVIHADGTYTYTLDNTLAATKALAANESRDETFTYTITDDKGSTASTTLTISVTGSNDAPVAEEAGGLATGTEDTPLVLKWENFGQFHDVDGPDAGIGVKITSLPPVADGRLQYTIDGGAHWLDVTANQVITQPEIYAGHLRFVPSENQSGDSSFNNPGTGNEHNLFSSFGFAPTDGTDDGAPQKVNITIAPVADKPIFSLGVQPVDPPSIIPLSVGLTRDYFQKVPTVGLTEAVNTATVESKLAALTPTSTKQVTDTTIPIVAVDDAYRYKGLIFLEAGHSYSLAGSRDDTLRVEIGGDVVFNQGYNNYGAISGAPTFTPPASGYYTLEIVNYNGTGSGNLDLALSVDHGAAKSLSTSNFLLYPDAASIVKAGGQIGELMPHNDGGYYAPILTSGNEDTYISFGSIKVSTPDTDGSETLAVSLSGLPAGTTLRDDHGHTFTAIAGATSVNLDGWDLEHLQIKGPQDFSGTLNLTLTATTTEPNGSTNSTTAELPVIVTPVNDAPIAVADSKQVTEGTTATTTVAGNVTPGTAGQDHDVDGTFSVTGVVAGAPSNALEQEPGTPVAGTYGSLVIHEDGHYVYTLDNNKAATNGLGAGQKATEVFTYTITDDHGASASSTLSISVTGANDPPTAADNNVKGFEDTPITLTWTGAIGTNGFNLKDVDTPSSSLQLRIVTLPVLGKLELAGHPVTADTLVTKADIDAGKLTYTPAPGGSGDDSFPTNAPIGNLGHSYASFQFQAFDGTLSSNTATMTIDIKPLAAVPQFGATGTWVSATDNFDDGDVSKPASWGGLTWRADAGVVEAYGYPQWTYNFVQNPHTSLPPNVNQVVDLEATGVGNNVISTHVQFATAGQVVEIDFDMIRRMVVGTTDKDTQGFDLYWNGVKVATVSEPQLTTDAWKTSVTQVLSQAGDNVLSFRPHDPIGTFGAVVDNVSVTTVADAEVNHAVALPSLSNLANFTDNTDGSERHTVTISDIPVGVTISDGVVGHTPFTATAGHTSLTFDIGTPSHTTDSAGLDWTHGLTMTAPTDFVGTVALTATATATELSNGETRSSSTTISETFMPTAGHLIAGTLNDDSSLPGTDGSDRFVGLDGNDTFNGGNGNDWLQGGTGKDTLNGGAGNDVIEGGKGSDTLTGGAGGDVFRWSLGDQGAAGTPANDVIKDFDNSPNGDKLDLRDLLHGETGSNLTNYLHFSATPTGDTLIQISTDGKFSGGNFSPTAVDQTITIAGVNLVGTNNDSQIIADLMTRGKLITDHG